MHRLGFLDSLRGLAAVYVMLYHMVLLPQPKLALPQWAEPWVMMGGSGVTLFFVVSAFSLCLTMPRHIASTTPLKSFFVHRFFRIAPLFYFWLVVTYFRDAFVFHTLSSFGKVATSVLFVFNFVPGWQEGIVWASWTIGVEMLFYLLFPLIYFRCDTWIRKAALLLFLLFVYSCAQVLMLYGFADPALAARYLMFSIVKHLPVFVLGMLVFDAFTRLKREGNPRRDLGIACICGFLVVFSAAIGGRLQTAVVDSDYWTAVAYGLLLIGLWLAPLGFVVNRATAYLGKISYSVYLAHPVVILLLLPIYPRIYDWRIGTSLKFVIATAMTTAAVLCVASVTFKLIEEPGMRLGRRVLVRRPAAQPAIAEVVPVSE